LRTQFPTSKAPHVQDDQKVSVHLMITIQSSGAQRLYDHPVCFFYDLC